VVLLASPVLAGPDAGTELAVTDLRWPADTDAATVRGRARVLDAAGTGKRIGTIAGGTKVTWKKLIATRDGCRAWVAIEPRGWVCATELAPGFKPLPLVPAGKPVTALPKQDQWAAIKPDGADAFDTVDQIKASTPAKHVGFHTYVAIRPSSTWLKVDGAQYVRTDQGFVATKDIWWYEPSPFAGVDLPQTASLVDYGWAVARLPGRKIAVRETPDLKGKPVRELSPRDRVTVFEDKNEMTRIGTNEWVDAAELRRIGRRVRPQGVGAAEKWIDVDLDHQTLVAYEGDLPVFSTLVSTGKIKWDTPTGVYRIEGKDAKSRMQDPGGLEDEWNVADVPWSMRFRKNFALHGTYWHDGFGRRRSHGCVNLSTTDAKRLYDWVTPDAPAGWTDASSADGMGTPVQIHSLRDPNPRWYDYNGKPL
jgi:hypothetical protein